MGKSQIFPKIYFFENFWNWAKPGPQKNLGRIPLLHEQWALIIIHAHCSCMNSGEEEEEEEEGGRKSDLRWRWSGRRGASGGSGGG